MYAGRLTVCIGAMAFVGLGNELIRRNALTWLKVGEAVLKLPAGAKD